MTEQEARVKYTPRKCNSQKEFDTFMSAINNEQTLENHPYLDRLRELNKQKALIETQKQALNVQLNAIKVERLEIESKQKVINRIFHQLKHEMVELNPKSNPPFTVGCDSVAAKPEQQNDRTTTA